MAESLPLDLITEILAKLPVKSLHRFKCVSKTWNSLITSSNFIKHHLRQTLVSNTNFNRLIISDNSILSSAISDVEFRFDIVNHSLNNIPHCCPPVDIIESVHGVLLIVDSSKKTFLLNPTNKTQRLIPPAPSHMPGFDLEVFGFGYDCVTDDYKVVRLAQCVGFGFFVREAYVYSMRNDCWESVNDETVSYTLQQINAVAVDGILYFSVVSRDYKPVLKCFDLRTSTFSLVDFPDLDSDSDKMMVSLTSLRGCLCLLVNYQKHKVDPAKFRSNPLLNRQFLYADVWELNESKWVKLFRIRKDEIRKQCRCLGLVTYSKDDKSLLVDVDGFWLGWYDLVTKKIKRVSVQGLGIEDLPYLPFTYVESLVSVVNNKERTNTPKKTIKKNDFLSSGFKLKL